SASMAVQVPSQLSGASNGTAFCAVPGQAFLLAFIIVDRRQLPPDDEHVHGAQSTVAGGASAYPRYPFLAMSGHTGGVVPSGPSHSNCPRFHCGGGVTHSPGHVPIGPPSWQRVGSLAHGSGVPHPRPVEARSQARAILRIVGGLRGRSI